MRSMTSMHARFHACISDILNIEQKKLFTIVSEHKNASCENHQKYFSKCSKKIIICWKNNLKKSQISFEYFKKIWRILNLMNSFELCMYEYIFLIRWNTRNTLYGYFLKIYFPNYFLKMIPVSSCGFPWRVFSMPALIWLFLFQDFIHLFCFYFSYY